MRSRLEGAWARCLDHAHTTWDYEPRAYANRGDYLPDFRLTHLGGQTYVEIKPPLSDSGHAAARRRMGRIWSSEPDAALWLISGTPSDFVVDLGMYGEWTSIDPNLLERTDDPGHVSRSLRPWNDETPPALT